MADKKVNVIVRARDLASRQLRNVGLSAGSMGKALKGAAGIAGAYFGTKALFNFAKGSIENFQQQELAVNHLKSALGNLGASSDLAGLQQYAAELQNITTMGDEATMEVMALGASLGGMSGNTLKAATQAAIGYSKSLGIDVKSAMTLVAKAAQGNTSAFTRYGLTFKEGMTEQEKFSAILEKGAAGMSMAQAETETTAGKLQQLSNTWGDMKEGVGEWLSGYLPGIVDGFKTVMVSIENWDLSLQIAWESAKLGLVGFWEDTKHFFGTAIPSVFNWFGNNWKNILTDMMNASEAIFGNMYSNIKNFFSAVWNWLAGGEYEFKWTGLMDGFESTLKELPKIAERDLSDTELEISKKLVSLDKQFNDKYQDKAGTDYSSSAVVAAGIAGMQINGGAGSVSSSSMARAGSSGSVTQESRFLGRSTVNKTEQNTTKMVALMEKSVKYAEKAAMAKPVNKPGMKIAIGGTL